MGNGLIFSVVWWAHCSFFCIKFHISRPCESPLTTWSSINKFAHSCSEVRLSLHGLTSLMVCAGCKFPVFAAFCFSLARGKINGEGGRGENCLVWGPLLFTRWLDSFLIGQWRNNLRRFYCFSGQMFSKPWMTDGPFSQSGQEVKTWC